MQKFLRDLAGLGRGMPIIGDASAQFSYADPVYIDSNGHLALATTTSAVIGYYCGQGETMSATNESTEKVCPDWVPAWNVEMVFGSSTDCEQTDLGTYVDIGTASTGAFELNLDASTYDTFFVLGFDPEGEGDNDAVVVVAADIQGINNIS